MTSEPLGIRIVAELPTAVIRLPIMTIVLSLSLREAPGLITVTWLITRTREAGLTCAQAIAQRRTAEQSRKILRIDVAVIRSEPHSIRRNGMIRSGSRNQLLVEQSRPRW